MGISNELILRQLNEDRALAASMLFPHRHPQESPEFHVKIMDLWRAADELVCIEAFREGGKTTLAEEFLLMEALFGNFRYLLIFSETYTKACQRMEALKHELLSNQRIYTIFGKQKGTTWSENKIILPSGVAIEAHGWEEEIRGFKHLDARPDRALLDDIENSERVRDKSAVDKGWKKIHMELLPAMDKELGKIRIIGTPLADDCIIRRCSSSPDWLSGNFPICDGEIEDDKSSSLWPSRYPMEWIRKIKAQYERNGMLREFNQEYMLIASGSQGKPFTEEMLRFEDVAPRSYSPKVLVIDPARTVEVKSSDQTGYVVVSRIGTRIYVHESGGKYWQPNEIIDGAFELSRKYDDCEVAIEKNSLDNWLVQPMRAKMLQTGRNLKMRTLQAPQDRDKTQFIMGLQSFFMAGDVVLVGGRSAHSQLVGQILNFPAGKRDILNALAYVNRVFSGFPVYSDFTSDNVSSYTELNRSSRLLLACNSSQSETTAMLCAMDGQYVTVLADWVSPLLPVDAIPDIIKLIRAVYPSRQITTWVTGDVFDQQGRSQLVHALKMAGFKANRAEYPSLCRGNLSPMIRTSMRGRRILMVDKNATETLHAMTMGYNFPTRNTGERVSDPEKNVSKTLIESLETVVSTISKQENTVQYSTNSFNATGTPYRSAIQRG